MRWKSLYRSTFAVLGLATLFLGTSLAASPQRAQASEAVAASDWDFQGEATALLGEVKTLAYNVERDTGTLSALARTKGASRQTHPYYLNSVGRQVNQLNQRLDRLRTIKHVTAPWQQQAIDRAVPIGAELADRTQAAVNHVSVNRLNLIADSYRSHLDAVLDGSNDLRRAVGQFIDYGKAQQQMQRISQQLEIAPL